MKLRRSQLFMPEGYCVKCKTKKEIVDGVEETMKNGRKAIKGKCPTCGTVMFKILGGKATPPPAAAPAAAPATETKPPGNK
jgi:ribosomal protein S27E